VQIEELIEYHSNNGDVTISEEKYVGENYMKSVSKSETPFIVNGVVVGHPFNLQEAINIFGKDVIPPTLGVYHLFYQDQLVYIGMSKNLKGRLLCHLKDNDMEFNNVLWFCASLWKKDATISDVLKIEHKMIKKYKPALNSVHANCR
jgi:hypothetical protein